MKDTAIMKNTFTSTALSESQKFGESRKDGHVGLILKSLTVSLLFSASVDVFAAQSCKQRGFQSCSRVNDWNPTKVYSRGDKAKTGNKIYEVKVHSTAAPIKEPLYWSYFCVCK